MSQSGIPPFSQPRQIKQLPNMRGLALRLHRARHPDSSDHFSPYGLVGLVLGVVMLYFVLIIISWMLYRRRQADRRTATGLEHRSLTMSADTVSPLFPDRPIRPLPKRRLRERLSPEAAESIQYPPAPPSSTPLFYYSYNSPRDDESEPAPYGRRESRPGLQGPGGRTVEETDRADDAARLGRIATLATSMSNSIGRITRATGKQEHTRSTDSQPPQSATSSADGYYDPFEITNNKKKRKIPTAGDSMLNGNHGSHDGVHGPDSPSTAIQSIEGHGNPSSPAYSSYNGHGGVASGTHNVSGPGRGRYGRVRNGRSPLRALSDSSSNWAGRNGKLRPSQWISPSTENTGIISTAIANAEKLPMYSSQENLSLLERRQQQRLQDLSAKAEPATTQFTFTCESQVPGTVAWPSADRRHTVSVPHASVAIRENGGRLSAPAAYPPTALPVRQMADQTTQTAAATPSEAAQTAPAPPAPPRKTRRQLNNELRQAARERRLDTQYANRRNPPSDDEIWICEFCEYEAIFNEPPRALIRKYELKDRRLRKEAAERQRLLEKAKMRGRKSKKNSKPAGGKTSVASHARTTLQEDASVPPSVPPAHDPGPEDEEYYEEEEGYYDREQEDGTDNVLRTSTSGGPLPLRPLPETQLDLDNRASTVAS